MRKGLLLAAAGAALSVGAETVPYFPSASDPDRQGFVRIINHGTAAGEVSIAATDDAGVRSVAAVMPIAAGETVHFNSDDLETGNASKGLVGIRSGSGDWRLGIESELPIEALAYLRTNDGFLTSMVDVVPRIGHRHRIATFNPASNVDQESSLRLVNEGDSAVRVEVTGVDDGGTSSGATVTVPPGRALTVGAELLETGTTPSSWPVGARVDGALGDGAGKWQLVLAADGPLVAMNLMSTPAGHVTNLSTVPELLWRGLVVAPESRCADADYDRDEYGRRHRSREDDIVRELGSVFGPYTGRCFASEQETDIEHMVALHEAHTSGLCLADTERKREFTGDLVNLTLAAPEVNKAKDSLDAFDWMPDENRCWFANRVVDVKLKYGLSVDREEADALELVLAGCGSTDLVKPACAE